MSDTMQANKCAVQLAGLLAEQAEVCVLLKELSTEQQELVNKRQEDELLRLLAEKQKLIARHEELSKKAQPYLNDWERLRDAADQLFRSRVESAWESLRNILNEVVKLENDSRSALQAQQDQASLNIQKIQKGKALHKAYGKSSIQVRPPRYRDEQG